MATLYAIVRDDTGQFFAGYSDKGFPEWVASMEGAKLHALENVALSRLADMRDMKRPPPARIIAVNVPDETPADVKRGADAAEIRTVAQGAAVTVDLTGEQSAAPKPNPLPWLIMGGLFLVT